MSLSSFAYIQLNSFKNCYVTLIILFNINHLFVARPSGHSKSYSGHSKSVFLNMIDPQSPLSIMFKLKRIECLFLIIVI